MSRTRVLLADDHLEFLTGIQTALADRYEVVGAVQDGDSLVRSALTTNPDLIISDLSMPGMNGFEAAQKLKSLGFKVKVIFVTVQSSSAYVKRAMEIGAVGYVLKSYVSEQLTVAIQEVLAGRTYISPEIGLNL